MPPAPAVRPLLILLSLAGLAKPAPAAAQNGEDSSLAAADARRSVPMSIPRLDSPIELDGFPGEVAWERVEPLPMTMFSPTFRAPITERTEVRIAHDDHYLYVSGRLYDSDPAGIRTNTLYRDVYSGDDLLAVVIDSYDDYDTAVWFATNPAGARTDRTVSNDAVFAGSGMPMNSDWNAHWDVVTQQNGEGWFAEFRIPFSTLGFQTVDGEVVMGLIVYRFIARKNERQVFPPIDPSWGGLAFAKPSQAQRVKLRDVRQTKPVYVTPYVLGGVRQLPQLDEADPQAPRWTTDTDPSREIGGDLRYSPTSNLALDLTLNTDFAQVEADDQQVNLTRFPLFFPEKRQFFQERASTFDFGTGGSNDRLFHSRRIGLDAGEIVRIWGGVRAVGRVGGLDYGLLDMQTAAHAGRSAENMGVLRLQQQILNPYSSVGGMLTSRLGTNGENNIAYGLDGVLRPFGDEWITLKWAQSFDETADGASALDRALLLARWERVRDEGFSYHGQFLRVGSAYLPRLGFQARRDFRYFGGSAQYKRFPGAESAFRSAGVRVTTGHYFRMIDGTAESRSIEPQVSAELKDGTELQLTGRSTFESVRDAFDVAGATIPRGEYWFHSADLRVQLPRSDILRGDFTATAGSFYDGVRFGAALNPAWNPSKHLELGAGYEINRLNFAERDERTTAHIGRLKVQVALDTRMSFSTFAQFSDIADLATFNARFRYHFREGTDLWIVYNEGLNTDRDPLDRPRLPLSSGRTLLVKYTHTLIW